ncbi:hypothetical protein UFOVP978_39 [uncultured Caudovirales phage]|uniref:Holin n=1 Tax=uncultured Caudovirales phage TaxID=2100421 RepID=A0A6J5PX75_9CAUD|nr:hypothetical protein UFOVP978_39 [uncultured Caudovirales phage]
MSTEAIALIGGLLVPVLVAILTKLNASRAVKAISNAFLSAVAAWIATVMPGSPISWKQAGISILTAWGVSTLSYYGFWKPTGITSSVASQTENFGVG